MVPLTDRGVGVVGSRACPAACRRSSVGRPVAAGGARGRSARLLEPSALGPRPVRTRAAPSRLSGSNSRPVNCRAPARPTPSASRSAPEAAARSAPEAAAHSAASESPGLPCPAPAVRGLWSGAAPGQIAHARSDVRQWPLLATASGTSTPTPAVPSSGPSNRDEGCQGITELGRIFRGQIQPVLAAVKTEDHRFGNLGSVDVITFVRARLPGRVRFPSAGLSRVVQQRLVWRRIVQEPVREGFSAGCVVPAGDHWAGRKGVVRLPHSRACRHASQNQG